ncbi:MAG TPA: SDR family NAD(P)-dependent oxidoreductase [Acidimicrobiales bacterium]|nr:SDR family NAD(P)-dependent oxidoreductase [Acidimicrobiales bacterium]
MESVEGKVAVVTGAASGIGLALARRFLRAGASVVLADVETEPLATAAKALGAEHGPDRVLAVPTDVREDEAVQALAAATFDRFGTAHVVCNNAGVGVGGRAWEVPADRWRWIVDVNLVGVANGIRAFVPRFVEQGEGHVVNTASAAGLVTGPGMSPYYATKHAVVALSEALWFDLRMFEAPVGVSVLCPEWVRTNIFDSERNRPDDVSAMTAEQLAPPPGAEPSGEDAGPLGEDDVGERIRGALRDFVRGGMDPDEVAAAVLDGIAADRFWIITHPTTLEWAQRRWEAIAADGHPTFWDIGEEVPPADGPSDAST